MEAFEKIAKILGPLTRAERKDAISNALRSVTFAESTLGRRVRKPRVRKEKSEPVDSYLKQLEERTLADQIKQENTSA